MKRNAFFIALSILATAAGPLVAQDQGFSGSFQLGFRSVDSSGRSEKFREDINLEDGPRLFQLDLELVPVAGGRRFADRIELEIDNYGGDPFETLSFRVRKRQNYNFRYQRRKSDYFYEDLILPLELSTPALSDGGDFHHFDFTRVHDDADLRIDLSDAARLNLGFDRYTRNGISTTTLDVQRDEFELEKPIDESWFEYRAGVEYSWDKVTLAIDETYREFDSFSELFLPGQSLGEDPEDATILDLFFLDQPYTLETNQHAARLVARPSDRWIVRLGGLLDDTELEFEFDERSQGTTFTGAPFAAESQGFGAIDRDFELFDLDLSFAVSERVALLFSARQQTLDQSGDVELDGEAGDGRWDLETTGLEGGVRWAASPKVTVTAGLRTESRDFEFAWNGDGESRDETETTDHDGYFVIVGWRPVSACRLSLELEDSSYDDPFTLASPTDRQRYRLQGRWQLANGLSITGGVKRQEYENSNSGWQADYDQADLHLGYRSERIEIRGGINRIDIERSIEQVVETLPGFGGGQLLPFSIAYGADTDFFDASLRLRPTERLTFGGDLRLYNNEGSFPIERDDWSVMAEADVGKSYLVHLGYRSIDYDETGIDFDDYDAEIFELALGYSW